MECISTVALVHNMQVMAKKLFLGYLKLNDELQAIKLETQLQQIQRTIDHAERKINELVYGLYGLSQEEIKIILRCRWYSFFWEKDLSLSRTYFSSLAS